MTERRARRKPGENRERLIEAGLIEFGLFGFHGASTARIAARAGVPQPHVYAHFATKQDLFLAVCAIAIDIVADDLAAASLLASDATALRAGARSRVDGGDEANYVTRDSALQLLSQAIAALGASELRAHLAELLAELRTTLGADAFRATFGTVGESALRRALALN
ncbi:TetR/AcrR family transcriptional regulator [Leucobacter sp. NPDC058333]|uniref:TetR/AcrR family transcriptional regulator n=1 Tax=Leucobacter sp. NPDC058333 TaxID=3346450 RepID=UPI00366502B2